MSPQSSLSARVGLIEAVGPILGDLDTKLFIKHLEASNGDVAAAISAWEQDSQTGTPPSSSSGTPDPVTRLRLVNQLGDVTDNNTEVVKAILQERPEVTSLRDVAIHFGMQDLTKIVGPIKTEFSAPSNKENAAALPTTDIPKMIRRRLFMAEPTAVVHRMLQDEEIKLSPPTQTHIQAILAEDPDFDMRKTSVSTALENSDSFKSLPQPEKAAVELDLKSLQRVQALTPVPEAIPALMDRKLTSALQLSNLSQDAFVQGFSSVIGDAAIATSIHQHAVASKIRNENFLISTLQTVRGSGLRVIDGGAGKKGVELRTASFNDTAEQVKTQVNLEKLFGSLDYCECSECNSVYSPASYFVELLEFLRHSNLDPNNSLTGAKTIKGTQLEKLLLRRPDLACIQLTCENTNTLIPYIDLALEVMESYVVHAPAITAYNVHGETSSELLASPQHTNQAAYEILRDSVYPLKLPYNLPIDTMRVFLQFLKTSRAELLSVYQSTVIQNPSKLSHAQDAAQRAADAEFNLITQEEYVILTKEGFWPLKGHKNPCTPDDYAKRIHLRQPWEYFGYRTKDEMMDDDPKTQSGLSWVKAQFMKRTGVNYTDIVSLLQTQFINPNMPKGKAFVTMQQIRFSYHFLQFLVFKQYSNKRRRFSRLIRFLDLFQPLIPLIEAAKRQAEDELCNPQDGEECGCGEGKPQPLHCCCSCEDEWRTWVYDWFEKVGSLIVLESGEGPMLPIKGRVYAEPQENNSLALQTPSQSSTSTVLTEPLFLGDLHVDGGIIRDDEAVAFVTVEGKVVDLQTGNELRDNWDFVDINIYEQDADLGKFGKILGRVDQKTGWLMFRPPNRRDWNRALYSSTKDTCDISKVRLLHLDGTPVVPEEYHSMVRFLRLWRKMGWTMEETDEAIIGLSKQSSNGGDGEETPSSTSSSDDESDDEEPADTGATVPSLDINAILIHQLVAVKKLLDLTSLPLSVLLTFWTEMPTMGEKSLYATTFLTHNLIRMDPVFQADANGNFLTSNPPEKISDHMAVVQAALRLTAVDITRIRDLRKITDELTLSNISELFRFSKLMKYLAVRSDLLQDIISLLGEPFTDADTTLALFKTWQMISDSNFTFQQLNYLIRDVDNLTHPLAPSIPRVLRITKTIFDGLHSIDQQLPDVTQLDVDNKKVNLTESIPARLALVYGPDLVGKINDLINGKSLYVTNAPSGLDIILKAPLSDRVKYIDQKDAKPPTARLNVTGILSEEDAAGIKALSSHPHWASAVDRLKKQALTFYNQTLASMFPANSATIFLRADTSETPTEKGLFFLRYFMPFLRARLATQLVQTTISDVMGLTPNVTSYLLSVVRSKSNQIALSVLLALKTAAAADPSGWKGFLIPSITDAFTFVITSDTKPPDIIINGKPISFPHQSEDPSNIWSSDPFSMVSSTLYEVQLSGMTIEQLSWSTSTTPATLIPSSAMLPSLSSDDVSDVFSKLIKVSLLIQGFNLSLDEVVYFHDHGVDFASANDNKPLELDKLTLGVWRRLSSYTILRDKLPKQPTRLIDLFSWSALPGSTDVVGEINKVTLWDKDLVGKILTVYNALEPKNFRNEVVLVKVKTALDLANKTQIDTSLLFEWAKPLTLSDKSYQKLVEQAEVMKRAVRARYNADDWEQAVRPLYDTLRKNQRDALVAYLVVEESLVKTGVVFDAEGLFEWFLIDCQMSSCLETSRIKQAIATIQLYVQRCLLGLEAEVATKDSDRINRDRWNWMKRYRVWEANRQVYLYPENWIVPSLRDDKSPFFLDLESQLQQKDVSLSNAAESLKSYLYDVAAVANMKVYGLFVQKDEVHPNNKKFGVHVVARRMNAPYDWYSRDYSVDGFWSPWIKMPVDIPNYDVDDEKGNIIGSGAYVSPFIWQGRPVLFFLHMTAKQIPHTDSSKRSMYTRMIEDDQDQNRPIPMWEIKLGYSLLHNGKWTQKHVSQASLRHPAMDIKIYDPKSQVNQTDSTKWKTIDTYPIPNQARYQMVPRQYSESRLNIDIVYRDDIKDKDGNTVKIDTNIGYFVFMDGGVSQQALNGGGLSVDQVTTFHYLDNDAQIFSFQAGDSASRPPYFKSYPSVKYPANPDAGSKSVINVAGIKDVTFNHTFADRLLKHINTTSELKNMFDQFELESIAADAAGDDPFGRTDDGSYNEQLSPYGIYNWETGLHAPMTLIDALLHAQQFEDALSVCHNIFDPSAVGAATSPSSDNSKYWKFFPFQALANTDAKKSLEEMFLSLSPQTKDTKISLWRDKPFAPHAVARMRPVAYMKWIAMKYIEIMIAYGDYYFRQNSLETIPDAIQCYVIASHVYGPRGQKIPKRGKTKPETYSSLLNRWDAFGNAIVQLEVEFPFSNQTSLPLGSSNGITGFANIFGFATSLYFCIPDNPKLRELRDSIDDRLYKIRNCMDINGVVRHLPLWDPPIDPALLVQATAQGLSIDTVLNDLSGPIPNYRFTLLLQKAIELCGELKSLGSGLLSAKEKKDGEALSTLRASHETIMSGLSLDIKNRQLDEANQALEQLQHSRLGPTYKLQYFKYLVGNTGAAPGETDDFTEIPNPSLEMPGMDGQLLLISPEREEVQKALAAQNWNIGIGVLETLAGIFHMFPDTDIDIKPFGVGTGLKWGGSFLGGSTSAVARGLQIYATYLTSSSANAGRKANLLRQLQDRIFQVNSLGMELKNIDKQIATQRIRVSTSEQEIKNQQTSLDQVTNVEEFLRTKYTNEELYTWMENTTKNLYNQSYNLAYDLAKRAEKSFKFERPQQSTTFIQPGYWTNARDGLLAGESLFLGLKQLEASYQESLGHDFEMTKHISVRQWAPLALLEFRELGAFELRLPELLFDIDCPGHYMRRISSVQVTIPCVVGPYTGINCTVRLLSHTIRISPRASGKADYPQTPPSDGDDDRFSVLNVPISAVALSSAQNDHGRHEFQMSDRYNPFEGAGCISTWRFELPTGFRSFDYSSISDVIMTIRYTSLDGGDKLKQVASESLAEWIKTVQEESLNDKTGGLFTFLDLKADFASEWYKAGFSSISSPAPGANPIVREMNLTNLAARLPIFTASTPPEKILATKIAILAKGTLQATDVLLHSIPAKAGAEAQEVTFKPGVDINSLTGVISADDGLRLPVTGWKLSVKGQSADGVGGGLWMVIRYSLT